MTSGGPRPFGIQVDLNYRYPYCSATPQYSWIAPVAHRGRFSTRFTHFSMTQPVLLPQLPLMLVGLPPTVKELLRQAGIPVAALPRGPARADEIGRFVLYDSQNPGSLDRALRAQRQGLELIDLAILEQGLAPDPSSHSGLQVGSHSIHSSLRSTNTDLPASPVLLLDQLKRELEARGGIWLRVADYPYPYQGAFSLAIEHAGADLAQLPGLAAGLPRWVSHFVPFRLKNSELARIPKGAIGELGWRISFNTDRPCGVSGWRLRLRRFRAAGFRVQGVAWDEAPSERLSRADQWSLGLRYCLHPSLHSWWQPESHQTSGAGLAWTSFGTALATRDATGDIRQSYQSGLPVFLRQSGRDALGAFDWIHQIDSDPRLPLLWKTTFGEFARWRRRRATSVRVFRNGSNYQINVAGRLQIPLGLELWRGDHVATFPLKQTQLTLDEEGLLFMQQPHKDPGGLAGALGCHARHPVAMALGGSEAA